MVKENHIDRALAFMEQLEKLGSQLEKADEQQKLMLQRMLIMSQEDKTETKEYHELEQQSKNLQTMIDKWRPIYKERLKMVKEAIERVNAEGISKITLIAFKQNLAGNIFWKSQNWKQNKDINSYELVLNEENISSIVA